ncbi:hypothetical protein FA10DRAFT_267441 [Acaromyces ingoldii]|uniref:Uncharacterized protein n=1 Tax=Acaromyces ingoldii TaxID=215250 RepID=A0A316YSN5_9BASI|nr:hypothetical protein FA10DRAFT_267441 [Acaromyces ingoldii]PWN91023.1 hypothetical protein FA10DRAFT_267441 [Acaromyces ingoldii]
MARPLSVQSSVNGSRPRRALSMYDEDQEPSQPPSGIDDVLAQMQFDEGSQPPSQIQSQPRHSPSQSYSQSHSQIHSRSDSQEQEQRQDQHQEQRQEQDLNGNGKEMGDDSDSDSSTATVSSPEPPRQAHAPSTDEIVATLEALLRHSLAGAPLGQGMLLSLQVVAAFSPTDVLDRRDEGKAFWDLALAALAASR